MGDSNLGRNTMQTNQDPFMGSSHKIRLVTQLWLWVIGIVVVGSFIVVGSVGRGPRTNLMTKPNGAKISEPEIQRKEKITLSVEDPRPVAKAIVMLEAKYGWIITYEDPRYINASDLSDVTEEVRKDLAKFRPGKAPRVLIPKGGTLTFDYDVVVDTNRPSDQMLVLQRLLAARAESGNSATFRIEKAENIVHIIPNTVKDASGKLASNKSLLDTVIT